MSAQARWPRGARVRFRVIRAVGRHRALQARRQAVKTVAGGAGGAAWRLTVAALKAGRYSVEVRATDVAGNSLERVAQTG